MITGAKAPSRAPGAYQTALMACQTRSMVGDWPSSKFELGALPPIPRRGILIWLPLSYSLADYLRVSNCNSLRCSYINCYVHNIEEVHDTNVSYHRSKRSYRVSTSISISIIWNSSRHSRHSYKVHWEEC